MSLELHNASVIHNCWEVVPSCTKCKNICANVCIHFHHSVKSIRLRLRQEFVPADGNTAWVMKQCWINMGTRLHIIAEAITAAIDWGAGCGMNTEVLFIVFLLLRVLQIFWVVSA